MMTPHSGSGVRTPASTDTETSEGSRRSETWGTDAPASGFPAGSRPTQRPHSFAAGSQQEGGQERGSGDGSLGSDLKQTAQSAAEALKQQAAQFAQDVGHELGKTGEDQKMRGADAIRNVARAIDSAASELEGQSPLVARAVHETARQVDSLSDSLSGRSVNELIHSASQLARAQPALFIGGSVAAGFALARFLMSTSAERPGAAAERSSAAQSPYHS